MVRIKPVLHHPHEASLPVPPWRLHCGYERGERMVIANESRECFDVEGVSQTIV